jgi:hypothetical protein
MGIWESIVLIIKFWPHVIRFLEIIQKGIEKGVNEADLSKGLERLEKGFIDAKTIKETADAAGSINDSFRK